MSAALLLSGVPANFTTGGVLTLVVPLGLLPIVLAWWWWKLHRRAQ